MISMKIMPITPFYTMTIREFGRIIFSLITDIRKSVLSNQVEQVDEGICALNIILLFNAMILTGLGFFAGIFIIIALHSLNTIDIFIMVSVFVFSTIVLREYIDGSPLINSEKQIEEIEPIIKWGGKHSWYIKLDYRFGSVLIQACLFMVGIIFVWYANRPGFG
jgi:hypothetical protein